MSSFSDANFVKKLVELNNTQQSIQTLSLWLIHHRKHSRTIVQVWHRELAKVKPSKKLTFLYLANDVIQNSKKKGPEFSKDFASVMGSAFKVAVSDADDKTKKAMERVLTIWQDRGVYDKEFIRQIKKSTEVTASSSPVEAVAPKRRRQEQFPSLQEEIEIMGSIPPEDADAEALVKRLSELENSASSDASVREKIAALPLEVSDVSQLDKVQDKDAAEKLAQQVEEACVLLGDYNKRLSQELDERKQVARMLKAFITLQRSQAQQTEQQLLEFRTKLAKVNTVKSELLSHIQKLPDLTLLPDVTGGLAPLPSAGDLFNVDHQLH